jgi:hypothetical protein
LFEILETQNILEGKAEIVLVPRDRTLLGDLIASQITPLSRQSSSARVLP